jgi:hypothetical protein
MTDTSPATTPAAIVCPVDGCHALIPDTIDDRRAHRRGHKHDDDVIEALRRAIRELREDYAKHRGSIRDEVDALRRDVESIDRAVDGIEIPAPVEPLTISRGPWPEDDEDDDTDNPTSTYLDDEQAPTGEPLTYEQTIARESAAAAFTTTTEDDTFPTSPRFVG